MYDIVINDITVKFPYEPYPVQRNYMTKVIESLTRSENAVLESPTGTGKTLSLLCATLAWVENEREKEKEKQQKALSARESSEAEPHDQSNISALLNSLNYQRNSTSRSRTIPQVIYATRTHSQIAQVMKELKRSAYNHMKAGVIASRDQLCIKPELQDKPNADKIPICRALVKKQMCEYHNRVSASFKQPELRENTILDIEDLGRIGRKLRSCPFYMSKEIVKKADIVFMPYNYLLDPQIRRSSQINLEKAIIILDEGHNVEKVCEDSASTLITSTQIDTAVGNAEYAINCLKKTRSTKIDLSIDDVNDLKTSIQSLKKEFDEIQINRIGDTTHKGDFVFSLLDKAGITEENHEFTIDLLERTISSMVEISSKKRKYVTGLRAVRSFLQIVFSSSAPELRTEVNRCYKVYIQREYQNKNQPSTSKTKIVPNQNAKILNFWCFSPKFGMQYLLNQDIRCLILTSGTLAPLEALISEMEISIPIRLQNPHIIKNFQVHVEIVGTGSDEQLLDSCYRNRDKAEYLKSLGNTILRFAKVVPDGLLVFFPSYIQMGNCVKFWKNDGVWSLIDKQKRILVEPKTKVEFLEAMKNYYATINDSSSNGAIFMAVMRGKVSEGLDFADMYGRAVIITGIPFAPVNDPRVKLKKEYLNDNRRRNKGQNMLSGDGWYVLDSIRAINQAIGRVIRHKDDYGGIFFCDNRFYDRPNQKDISEWIQNHLQNQDSDENFNSMLKRLSTFYTNAEKELPKPELKAAPEEIIEDLFENDDNLVETGIDSDLDSSDSDDEENIEDASTSKENNSNDEKCEMHETLDETSPRKKMKYNNHPDSLSENEQNGLIRSKNPFLQIMESNLGNDKYQELLTIVEKYNIDEDYKSYRDSLFEIFEDKLGTYSIRSMLFFIKPIHREDFEKDVDIFIQSKN